jgi:hypothetical protein
MKTQEIADGTVHKLPADFRRAIESDATAKSLWADITPLARNEWICWVVSAKHEATRRRRIKVGIDKCGEACAGRAVGPDARTADNRADEDYEASVSQMETSNQETPNQAS